MLQLQKNDLNFTRSFITSSLGDPKIPRCVASVCLSSESTGTRAASGLVSTKIERNLVIAQLCRDPKTLLDKVESVCRIHKPEHQKKKRPMEPLRLSVFFMLLLLDACLNFPRLSVCVLHWCDALSGAGQTNPAVAPQGHGVGVRRVDLGQTVGKSDGDEARQVVGADSLVGLNERGLQDGLLQNRSQ